LTRQSIGLPETVKEGLNKMAIAFGMMQNALINLAVPQWLLNMKNAMLPLYIGTVRRGVTKRTKIRLVK